MSLPSHRDPKKVYHDPYHFCITFPDRIYPFASIIEGKKVRWRRSYEHRLAEIQDTLGDGHYGLKLGTYREICHVLGSGLFIATATLVSHTLWGSDVALPVLFLAAMLAITFQEFYLQPRTYNQRFGKSLADWISWVAPLTLYLFVYIL
ncbi:MAG: hypothetical protein JWN90_137 [Parcubacteria group bacterium]|nr:hypothetical protein [Parcubacteria group bacterium]